MNPVLSFFKSILYLITGRLRFEPHRIGEVFTAQDGYHFIVFRSVRVRAAAGQAGAIFIVRFHVAGMSARANRMFSLIPMWFIMGLPGFRSKCWMLDDASGDFCGYYEWDSLEDARSYSTSFAMRFMSGRSTPGSVSFDIFPAEEAPAPPFHNA